MDEDKKDHGLEALGAVTAPLKFVTRPPAVGEPGGEPVPLLIEVKSWAAKQGYELDPAVFYEYYDRRHWAGIVHWRAILHYWNERQKIYGGGEVRSFKDFKDRKGR